MSLATIKKFKEKFTEVKFYCDTRYCFGRWVSDYKKLNDTNTHVLKVVLYTRENLIPDIFGHACLNNHIEIYKYLINKSCITNEIITDIFTTCYESNKFTETFKLLLDHPISDDKIIEAFNWSCTNGFTDLVKFLIDRPCIIDASINEDYYLNDYAARVDKNNIDEETIDLLINKPGFNYVLITRGIIKAKKNDHQEIVDILTAKLLSR